MKITSEQQILDEAVRHEFIKQHILGEKNQRRKSEAFKAYECLKDQTCNYVLDQLLKQFDQTTVAEMQYAISNISFLRKVIDKLARVYANGVKRTMDKEADTKSVEELADVLEINQTMKKTNRYFRTFKNTLVYVYPMIADDSDQYSIEVEAKAPFSYDVVENPNNNRLPLAVICSDYAPTRRTLYTLGDAAAAGRTLGEVRSAPVNMDRYAFNPQEAEKQEYVWWTKNYHFTTNGLGKMLSDPMKIDNPILKLPFVNYAEEQDNGFWAKGGQDLVDSGIKINTMITNSDHIGVVQGYGQLYMTGKNLPKSVKLGPNYAVQLPQEEGEPEPKIGYLNSNPPLDQLKAQIEMAVALMLTTNNLSTKGVSTKLEGGATYPSGIAMIIDKSESTEDIQEQSILFIANEPKVWVLIGEWLNTFKSKSLLTEELQSIKVPKDLSEVQVKFPSPNAIVSEMDELLVLEKRKAIGLDTQVETLMRDDPSLKEEDAKKKLADIKAEKQANAAAFGLGDANAGNQSKASGGEQQQNSGDAGPPIGPPKDTGNTKDQNQE